ncbi:MAG: alpha/beta hydrolase [Myxococcota bacterium]|nr:alpha/beta hydrolase [Myxococcota bacterium]
MLEGVFPTTPLVPRLDQVQSGYEAVSCRDHPVEGSLVRLFTVPSSAPADKLLVAIPGLGASGRSFALMSPLARRRRLWFWTPPLKTPAHHSPLWHNVSLLAHPEAGLPQRFVLLGSSFGSLVALAFALHHPHRVSALVLASPVASTRRIRRFAMTAANLLRVPLPFAYLLAPVVARILGGRHLPEEGRSEIVRESRRIAPLEMVRRLRDILGTDLLPELEGLQVPTLIVHGRRDLVVPLGNARDVAARIPNARLEVIRGAAHLPYMSHPDRFNAVVTRFLREVAEV